MTDTSASTSTDTLLESLRALEPRVIGATGGSGTRVVGQIVRAAGMYTGTNLNDYDDALDLAAFSDRWINRYLEEGGEGIPATLRSPMVEDFAHVLETHRADAPGDAPAWGWKEPRSIYLLPFLDAAMPKLRFLHFVRDGRDMAFSENQKQLEKHGDTMLADEDADAKKPVRSITLWARVNTRAAEFGEERMPGRYMLARFEDLCADPAVVVRELYAFFGLEGDIDAAAALVRPPKTLGRWQSAWKKKTVADLHAAAGPALRRFGYLEP